MIDVKRMFIEANALLEGHFLLSSGLHSDFYMQAAKVLQNTKNAKILGEMIANEIKNQKIEVDIVVSPAMGGLIIGHEVASSLAKDFVFTERVEGKMVLRRGFEIPKNFRVAIVEDVFTTGKSTREVIEVLDELGANVVCCCSIVDRSGGTLNFDIPKIALLTMNIKTYKSEDCPICKTGKELVKPGSRFLKK